METEFAFRHHNSDPEKAAAVYESIKVSLQSQQMSAIKRKCCAVASISRLPSTPQCLKAEDIASAVTFVLSAPPHVQVNLSPFPSTFYGIISACSFIDRLFCAVRSEMCRWGRSSRCRSSKMGEASGGADRQQPWRLLSDLCWPRGKVGGVKTSKRKLCRRGLEPLGGCMRKWRAWTL